MSKKKTVKRRKKKRTLKVGRLLFLLILVIGIVAGSSFATRWKKGLKAISKESEAIIYHVDSSMYAKDVYEDLEQKGIIRDSEIAYIFSRQNGYNNILAGDFEINKNMTPEEIMKILNDPENIIVDDTTVTIVEGDWAKHIAEVIGENTNVTAEQLLSLWNSKEYITSLMDQYPFLTDEMFNDDVRIYLEGYLAPNTYIFYKDTTAEEITEKLLDQTLSIYNKYEKEIQKCELSVHQVFTLASIVQYESGSVSDMEKIAGVFYNRMDTGMNLGSSVTVCYALDLDKNGDWKECEYNPDFNSPYNTYLISGLPPGPIDNAGESAIEATLKPDQNGDYLFFLADVCGDGKVYYSQTFEEHDAKAAEMLTCY